MANQPKITGRADSMPGGLAAGAAASILMTLLMAVIMAKMVDCGKLPWEKIGYGILLATIFSAFLGGKIAYARIKRQRLLVCALSGGIYYCMLFLIATVFFGGQYEGMGVTALIVLAGSGCAFLLGSGMNPGRKQKLGKKHYR